VENWGDCTRSGERATALNPLPGINNKGAIYPENTGELDLEGPINLLYNPPFSSAFILTASVVRN